MAKRSPPRGGGISLFGRPSPAAALQQVQQLLRAGRSAEAERLLAGILLSDPRQFDALHLRALLCMQRREWPAAIDYLERARAVNPAFAPLHNNLGVALRSAGRPQEALAAFDEALRLRPAYPDALVNRGNCLRALGRTEEAAQAYEAALALQPAHAQALFNRGLVRRDAGGLQEALADFEAALALQPAYLDAACQAGLVLLDLGRPAEALQLLDKALAVVPPTAAALNVRGLAREDLQRHAEALADFGAALALEPDNPDFHNNCGNALEALGRLPEALAAYERALALAPQRVQVLANIASVHESMGRLDLEAQALERLLAQRPHEPFALGNLVFSRLREADWSGLDDLLPRLREAVDAGHPVMPFTVLAADDDPVRQLRAARNYVAHAGWDRLEPAPFAPRTPGSRIRIAYVSGDLHDHATTRLLADCLAAHDRERFEITAVSYGRTRDAVQDRLRGVFDRFLDATALTDEAVVAQLRAWEIDIAVDLKGYTLGARPGIFARRAAPVQMAYLGYPGTSGLPGLDYLLGDAVVTPAADQPFYSECLLRLPGTYQANNALAPLEAPVPTRAEAGLPDQGFVFCAFNNTYKVTPAFFAAWMRLLRQVPGSVLWLLAGSERMQARLRAAAEEQGVDPARIIFAPRCAHAAHLARHRLADLGLDNLPYGAHTTASDALRMHVPVVTCRGRTFAGRVGASLLSALGLPQLVAGSLAEYEAIALDLATDPAKHAAVRARLAEATATSGVYDPAAFARKLEAAYRWAWERHLAGLPPAPADL